MNGIAVFALVLALLVFPVKIAASLVGAHKTGFFTCLFALIIAALIQAAAGYLIPGVSQSMGVLLSLPLTALAYMMVLETTFLKALLIAVLQGVFLVLAVLALLPFMTTA